MTRLGDLFDLDEDEEHEGEPDEKPERVAVRFFPGAGGEAGDRARAARLRSLG